jgi:hypothetical protein
MGEAIGLIFTLANVMPDKPFPDPLSNAADYW